MCKAWPYLQTQTAYALWNGPQGRFRKGYPRPRAVPQQTAPPVGSLPWFFPPRPFRVCLLSKSHRHPLTSPVPSWSKPFIRCLDNVPLSPEWIHPQNCSESDFAVIHHVFKSNPIKIPQWLLVTFLGEFKLLVLETESLQKSTAARLSASYWALSSSHSLLFLQQAIVTSLRL